MIREAMIGPLDARYRGYGADIHSAGRHLQNVINDILDISKIEGGRLELRDESVAIEDMIESCRRIVAAMAEATGVTLSVDAPAGLPLTSRTTASRITSRCALKFKVPPGDRSPSYVGSPYIPPGNMKLASCHCTDGSNLKTTDELNPPGALPLIVRLRFTLSTEPWIAHTSLMWNTALFPYGISAIAATPVGVFFTLEYPDVSC